MLLHVLLSTLALVLADQGTPPPAAAAAPKKITMVTVEGCAAGLALKSARPASIEDAELIVSPTYRLSGTKAIKADIKKLSGQLVRVRAELSEVPGEPSPSVKLGNATVSLGSADDPISPRPARTPEPPALDVQSITSLEQPCRP
jgi:hypothetical protein